MKLYVDLDNVSVIPQMIEEISNFKAFIKPYMLKGVDYLVGHSKTQQSHPSRGSSYYAHPLIGAQSMVYTCDIKTKMENVCS